MKKILLAFFLFTGFGAFAQTADIEQLKQQAKAAGYSDAQIEAAVRQVQSQAASASGQAGAQLANQVMEVPGEKQDPVFVAKPDPQETRNGKFGVDLLKSGGGGFDPNEYGPVPDDYVLGTGDELQVSVWGQSEFYLKAEIDRRGLIQIPTVGLVSVSGLTLKEAEGVLKERLSKSYAGIRTGESKFAITLSKVRAIRVFVGGMVNKPGAYKLTAISSVITALYAAGGLKENADFRQVAVIHPNGKTDLIDLYGNLLGVPVQIQDKIDHNDMILVKAESFAVEISGEVNRPGGYDLLTGETFSTLLSYAGGAKPNAWLNNVVVSRIVPGQGKKVISFDAGSQPEFILMPGDQISVKSSIQNPFGLIEVTGAVRQPGKIQFTEGMKVKDAIEKAGGVLDWTYLDRGQILITEPDSSLRIMAFNPAKAMKNDPAENLTLTDKSVLILKSIWEIDTRYDIKVIGFVNSPGDFRYRKGMTVGDALFLADGFQKNAYTATIEVARVDPKDSISNDRVITFVKTIKNNGTLTKDNPDLTFLLEPMDQVYVRKSPFFDIQRTVTLTGEVRFPGSYSLTSKDEKLASVIKRAGGLKSTAYLEGATINREKENVGLIAVDFTEALEDEDSPDNLILLPGDNISIPERDFTVKIKGEVLVETSVLYQEGSSADYYIEKAGGYSDNANISKVYVILPNGRVFNPGRYWVFHQEILSGSVIVVPPKEKEEKVDWKGWVTITTSTITSLVTLIILLQRTNQ